MSVDSRRSGARLFRAATVVAGGVVHRPGWLEVAADGRVSSVGPRPPTGGSACRATVDLRDGTVVPGFVDMHVHGGGGASFDAGSPEQVRTAIATHRAHGTTRMCASLVSAPPELLVRQVRALVPQVESGALAGIHLEGPWLAATRCGAHDPAALRLPKQDEIRRLLDAGAGTIRMVTLAPELPGAPAAIERFRAAGVVVAIGHTEADHRQTRAAIAAGASVAAHLFNAMRPIGHREPGPVVALTADPRVTVELIADGVHLDPAMYRWVGGLVGPSRIALITDAMAAAGRPDGEYRLGTRPVTVTGGVARLTGSSTIAGSTATMDRLFRMACGVPDGPDDSRLLAAVLQTSTVPARALGIPVHDLSPGTLADLVVLSPEWEVRQVFSALD